MTRYQRHHWLLAATLAGLAGFVDAIGFLETGGFFTAFMSGNSTRMAVGAVHDASAAGIAVAMIATFVTGVTLGAVLGNHCEARTRLPVTVLLVATLLALAAGLAMARLQVAAIGCTLLAMGAENTAFQREGQVSIGLTYMTGTLVKLGQALARVHQRGHRGEWLPYLLLWAGLVTGALLGALAFQAWGLSALWVSAGLGLALAGIATLPQFAME
ncbi:YoaK family protein [Sphingomonas ursincola]|uniref:DUF1275 domain-containing protein n=1 Tax=Sphingomonas ursincola TaxID=56361 RepID=A0A7V8RCJ4_9SPHN|nr:YoaK family protein [Sphingomonas ursincola]MBA1373725.1 DUF1275 domain-containing protein [Sphingomonas ursincola]